VESIKTQNTGWLQNGLLFMVGLVVILMVAATTLVLARHDTSSSTSPAPTIQGTGQPAGMGADAKAGYSGTAPQTGAPLTAHHQ
jgi:hypothetical protein